MRKKPFIWFLVTRNVNLQNLKKQFCNTEENYGLAIPHLTLLANGSDIISTINSEFKLPRVFSLKTKEDRNSIAQKVFKKKFFPSEWDLLQKETIGEEYIPSFTIKIGKGQKLDTDNLLLQLSEYFLFRSEFPTKEATVYIHSVDPKMTIEIIKLLLKVGIDSFCVRYNEKNIEALKKGLTEVKSNANIIAETKPEIFKDWRTQIDALDNQLIETLAKRMQIVSEMGDYKSQHGMPLFEAGRWQEILQSRKKIANSKNVDEELIGKIFEAIHLSSLKKMLED
jgi:chorismate mutase